MSDKINSLRDGFKHCVFLNRNPKVIEGIFSTNISDPKIHVLASRPKSVKVETIDDLHDKLSLLYDNVDENVEATITWRKSSDGTRFAISEIEEF
jgi:hypothetical protein